MYTLYIANKNYSSWSLRPWLLLKALNIPFKEELHPFTSDNWDQFRTFSPNGLVPCLHDADLRVWDSLAIVEYIAEQHSAVWPESLAARTWARCACSEMHGGFSAIRNQCGMNVGLRIKLNDKPASLIKDVKRLDELWCEGLNQFGGPFLAGKNFSAVDAFFAPVVFRIQTYGLQLSEQANAYVQAMLSHKDMQQWQAESLKETWRDDDHEKEVLEIGTILKDYREPL